MSKRFFGSGSVIVLLAAAFVLSTHPVQGAFEDAAEVETFSLEVLHLHQGSRPCPGELVVTAEEIVFQPGELEEHAVRFSRGDIREIQIRHARMLRIRPAAGRDVSFTTVGTQVFDENLSGFLKQAGYSLRG